MNKLLEFRRRFLSTFPPIFLPKRERKDIIIAGSGRGGTTWLLNIIASLPGYRVIFEPFHPIQCKKEFNSPFSRPYLRAFDENKELENYIKKLLTQRIKNKFINSRNKRFITYQTVIKFIRANLLLDWLYQHFHLPIVFMIRHPCAVVLQRIKLQWGSHLEEFLNQKKLMEDFLAPYEDFIQDIIKEGKKHKEYALMWAIENFIPLKWISNRPWFLITYEELFINRTQLLKKLFQYLGYKYSKKIEKESYKLSSTAAVKDKIEIEKKLILSKWQHELSNEEIKDILDIIEKFEVSLYNSDIIPHKPYF